MIVRTFEEFLQQVFPLFRSGQYAAALELVLREGAKFPEYGDELYYLRAAATAKLGRHEEAVNLLHEALSSGYWFSERTLRETLSFAALQGRQDFERLVAASKKQHASAQKRAAPRLISILPDRQQAHYPLLIALHRNGSNARDAGYHWRPALTHGWLLALPQSSQIEGPNAYVWDDRQRAIRELQQHYEDLREAHPLACDRVVVGGVSLSAGLAAWLVLSGQIAARGFIGVGPFLQIFVDQLEPHLAPAAARGVRGYLLVGDQDHGSYEGTVKLAELLQAAGIACELELRPGLGHAFPTGFERSLRRALDFLVGH